MILSNMPFTIQTSRLTLLPFTKIICEQTLSKSTIMLSSLGIKPGDGWPDLDTMETLPRILVNLDKVMEPSGFESWMIIIRDTNLIIGDAGFKGLPNKSGEIDLGYGIIAAERNKGFAYEATVGLLNWAFNQEEVAAVTASCLINNLGSQRILSLLNFSTIKNDNKMIYWRLSNTLKR